jgi:hypothetical protein
MHKMDPAARVAAPLTPAHGEAGHGGGRRV